MEKMWPLPLFGGIEILGILSGLGGRSGDILGSEAELMDTFDIGVQFSNVRTPKSDWYAVAINDH